MLILPFYPHDILKSCMSIFSVTPQLSQEVICCYILRALLLQISWSPNVFNFGKMAWYFRNVISTESVLRASDTPTGSSWWLKANILSTYLDPDGDQMALRFHRERFLELDNRRKIDYFSFNTCLCLCNEENLNFVNIGGLCWPGKYYR